MPAVPNIHVVFVLLLIAIALALFATERLRLESAAFLVLVTLLVTFAAVPYAPPEGGGQLDPVRFFDAFGSEALIAVCALMILGKGIEATRALEPLVGVVSRHWSNRPTLMRLGVLVATALLSAFLNNTPIVVMLLPALIAIAQRNNISPSKLLMPIGLGTIVGGMATTIGTSTNLLVVTLAKDIADIRFGMFDFSWYLLIAGGLGLLYLWLLAPRVTPVRRREAAPDSEREFIASLRIRPDSSLAGKSVADLLETLAYRLDIHHLEHADGNTVAPLPTVTLRANDRVFVRGTRESLREAEQLLDATLKEIDDAEHHDPDQYPKLAEIAVTPGSGLEGRTLAEAALASQYGITPVALHRPNPRHRRTGRRLHDIPLRAGDILLCEGTLARLRAMTVQTNLLLLHDGADVAFTRRAPVALAVTAGVVGVAAAGWLPIAIAALTGVGLMLAARCIGWRHVGEALNTQVVLVIVVSLALGDALMATGGDAYLAAVFGHFASGTGAAGVVMALMLFSAALTNVVTNNAAAVISTPIAVQIAAQLEIEPRAIILAVLFGANLSFVTPIGYQTNLLVFSAGGYRFSDFMRVGAPLLLIMWLTLSWLVVEAHGLA